MVLILIQKQQQFPFTVFFSLCCFCYFSPHFSSPSELLCLFSFLRLTPPHDNIMMALFPSHKLFFYSVCFFIYFLLWGAKKKSRAKATEKWWCLMCAPNNNKAIHHLNMRSLWYVLCARSVNKFPTLFNREGFFVPFFSLLLLPCMYRWCFHNILRVDDVFSCHFLRPARQPRDDVVSKLIIASIIIHSCVVLLTLFGDKSFEGGFDLEGRG